MGKSISEKQVNQWTQELHDNTEEIVKMAEEIKHSDSLTKKEI